MEGRVCSLLSKSCCLMIDSLISCIIWIMLYFKVFYILINSYEIYLTFDVWVLFIWNYYESYLKIYTKIYVNELLNDGPQMQNDMSNIPANICVLILLSHSRTQICSLGWHRFWYVKKVFLQWYLFLNILEKAFVVTKLRCQTLEHSFFDKTL